MKTRLTTVGLTAASMLAIYAAAIAFWRPVIRLYPGQDAYNLARAERALLVEQRANVVIVGSSLGVRIPDDWLPSDWLNLSLGGKSAVTGLVLLAASDVLPKRVLVEINTAERTLDAAFLTEAAGPIPLSLRRLVPGLRSEYRPINLVLALAARWDSGPNVPRTPGPLDEACRALDANDAHDPVSMAIVDREVDAARKQAIDGEIERGFASLRAAISALEGKGVEILFFEWPTDPRLMQSPRATAIRSTVLSAFMGHRIVRVSDRDTQTEDGLHLAPLSARRAACALVQAV